MNRAALCSEALKDAEIQSPRNCRVQRWKVTRVCTPGSVRIHINVNQKEALKLILLCANAGFTMNKVEF